MRASRAWLAACALALCALAPAAHAFPTDGLPGPGDQPVDPPPAAPTAIATTASPDVAVGGRIHDTATLTGGTDPTGTITFNLHGPDDPDCSGAPVATSSRSLDGSAAYESDEFTPTRPGTYRWVASYGGDQANAPSAGSCDDPSESVTVTKAAPAIATTASPGVAAGGQVHANAALAAGFDPTGTITFALYGPDDPDCSGAPVATSSRPLDGSATYESDAFTPRRAGAYRWVASYGGDANNAPSTGGCADSSGSVTVTKAAPAIATTASPGVAVGGQVHASATLAGGSDPTGTITFELYGPDDSSCSRNPIATSTSPVHGAGSYVSDAIGAARAGGYRWVASYSGDAGNAPAPATCEDGAALAVTKARPSVATQASPGVPAGGKLRGRATLTGGAAPTGTISFALYGPDDPTCSRSPIATSTRPVGGAGAYESGEFAATRAGAYRWVASYGGDADNAPSGGRCEAGVSVTVTRARTTITTHASPSVTVGAQVHDRARLAGGVAPTGTITFALYGPGDPKCSRAPVATSTRPVTGPGTYRSEAVTPTRPETYLWVASYGGDANNAPSAGRCGDVGESVEVRDVDHTTTTLDAPAAGEGLLALTAHAPDTDWGVAGRESAVATVSVDGRYSQDVVLFNGAQPFTYRLALGRLAAGRHVVNVRFDRRKSPKGARGIVVDGMQARMTDAKRDLAARYTPILYGRDEPRAGGRYENNHTDVPLLLYHTETPDPQGALIEYTVIWSNEDGGTPVDAMMPRWGRTTDIEWVYRVRVDRAGRRVSEAYQDPSHRSLRFRGGHDDDHPLLQTAAANNGVLAVRKRSDASRYRFFMDPSSRLGAGLAREVAMDAHPWTYALSAAEAAREHKFEDRASAKTATVSDPRNYLFVRLAKRTTPAADARGGWVGTAIKVKLRGSSTWYRSDHGIADWSVEPDGEVTTSVELPPGSTQDDVREISAMAHPVGHVRRKWRVRVTDISTAFFLDGDYRPLAFSPGQSVHATLTTKKRTRRIWLRP